MAKIDVSTIEGFANMTAEQKVEALANYEFPDPDYTGYVKKDVFDKTASELASWKKKHNEANGEMDKVFAAQKKFLEQYEKDVKAKVLKGTPKPPAGGKGGEMTKADFLKLDTKAQMEFIKEHSDWQTILK